MDDPKNLESQLLPRDANQYSAHREHSPRIPDFFDASSNESL